MNSSKVRQSETVIYFDVTTLMNNNGLVTGITRVEMCLVHEMLSRSDVEFVAWHQQARRFFRPTRDLLSFVNGPTYRQRQDIEFIDALPIGSRMLLQGNAWLQNGDYVDDLAALVRRSDANLTLLIHDILPVSHSQYFPEDQVKRFGHCLERMVDIAARFLVDSNATARELQTYLKRHRGISPQIGVIRLGDGFASADAHEAKVDLGKLPEVVRTALADRRFVLSVGSLSPHKNRRLLYDIWARLYERLGEATPTLLIVGGTAGAGTDGAHLAEQFRRDERTRSHIQVVHGLEDSALDLLYRRALFTVFPSLGEGWGLPVAESLQNGKICIASATSSMVEIAPECTDLVDPLDVVTWVEKAFLYSTDPMARSEREGFIRSHYRPVPWHETVRQLIEACDVDLCAIPPFRAYVGQTLDLSSRATVAQMAAPGVSIFDAEAWGAWTTGANLRFDIVKTSTAPCHMVLMTAFRGQSGVVKVFDGSKQLAEWRYDEPSLKTFFLDADRGGFVEQVNLRFVVEGGNGVDPVFGIARIGLIHMDWPQAKRDDIVESLTMSGYRPGEDIPFADLKKGLAGGWHAPEAARVWSGAGVATLLLPIIRQPGAPLALRLHLGALVAQDVEVIVNGARVATWSIGLRPQFHECRLDDHAGGELLAVEIVPSVAISPSALGMSKDARVLGVSLTQIELCEASDAGTAAARPLVRNVAPRRAPPTVGLAQPLRFQLEGNGAALLKQGWHEVEADHVWSSGTGSLDVSPPRARRLRMRASLAAHFPQQVQLVVNDEAVAKWRVDRGGLQTYDAIIPAWVLRLKATAHIEFLATAAVPAVMSEIPDGRKLGVALGEMSFEEAGLGPWQRQVKRLRSLGRRLRAMVSP